MSRPGIQIERDLSMTEAQCCGYIYVLLDGLAPVYVLRQIQTDLDMRQLALTRSSTLVLRKPQSFLSR